MHIAPAVHIINEQKYKQNMIQNCDGAGLYLNLTCVLRYDSEFSQNASSNIFH